MAPNSTYPPQNYHLGATTKIVGGGMTNTGGPEESTRGEHQRDGLFAPPSETSPMFPERYGSIPTNIKTPSSFHEDLMELTPGSIPHSALVAITIGVICGISAFLYYTGLEWALEYLWKSLPEQLLSDSNFKALWIPGLGLVLAVCVGVSVRFLGEPGDLPYTIKCVHESAYISMDHVLPMVVASQFSILGGGSLGPEAPLVAICAALGGWVSRSLYRTTDRNLVRKHTLMGMSGALAAFFGCPLGGSLFALEVNSRFGIEYFEHTVEAIFCGEVCLAVFRSLARLPIEPIWKITEMPLPSADPRHIVCGTALGLLGAGIAAVFTKFHFSVMGMFRSYGLLKDEKAIERALVGAVVILGIGVLMPATLFWGEYEFQTISTLSPSSSLPHVWPTSGFFGFEMNSFWTATLVAIGKLVAISFTVSGGYRGGFIFPLFVSGAAFGRAVHFLCPFIPVQLSVLCMAAALNVAVTRTSISTTLILAFLAGEQNSISAILAASLTSLFATAYMPFIKTQVARADIECSIFLLDEDGETAATDPLTPFPQMRKSQAVTVAV